MKQPTLRWLPVLVAGLLVASFFTTRVAQGLPQSAAATDTDRPGRAFKRNYGPGAATPPNLVYHGGPVLTATVSQAIFWGARWADSTFSADKITGVDAWYSGYGGSRYGSTVKEYAGSNGTIGPVSYKGHLVDTTPAADGSDKGAILAEVAKLIRTPDPSGNGYYAVYVDVPSTSAPYCAWHSSGKVGSTPVQFAFFFNMDGDPGCDPRDGSKLHTEGLAALANMSAHELSEARTDPTLPGAWFGKNLQENGDQCDWSFGSTLVTFANGSSWKLQGEWSNNAYGATTGFANQAGQKGCIDGN